ncbi:MAG: Smr/MutS family protein [Spirosomataceae bacterium]
MLYPQHIEQKLGFDRIRELLREQCISSLGRAFVDKIRFSDRFDIVDKLVRQVAEFQHILQVEQGFPSQNYLDVSQHLAKAAIEGYFLTEEECFDLKLSLRTIQECLRFFQDKDENQYPYLRELTDKVQVDRELLKELDRVIDDRGKVRDTASKELQEIRRALIAELASLRKKLDNLLKTARKEGWTTEDATLTIRNGRLVIPIAAEHKRKIRGFVQDESDTGKTVFLEPADALDSNNEIKELEARERREIVRILTELTSRIRPHVESLRKAYVFLGLMDFIRAKAKFAIAIEATHPLILNQPVVKWEQARHPLLFLAFKKQQKKVVPLKVELSEKQRILLVSGPNAGGKSVMLKTIGLVQYMFQCGLLVPVADHAQMGIFRRIFIDIGDEQSLDNDLSTYSSHLTNMKHFLLHSDKKTLFLIDEFGTGTEPTLGGAIAESILEELNRSGAYGVINTHYTNLKVFADRTEGMINGAMRFDGEHLEPLYELEMGRPGSSFALEIAQKIGLPKAVLEKAKQKLGKNQVSFEKIVKELDIEKKVFAEKNLEYTTKQRKLDQLLEQYNALKNVLETDKKRMLNEAKAQAKQLIKDSNAKIEATIRAIREQGAEKLATKEIRQQLEEFVVKELRTEEVELPTPKVEKQPKSDKKPSSTPAVVDEVDNSAIGVGSLVRIKGQTTVGEVLSLKGKDAEVAIGDLKSFIKLNRLEKVSRREYKEAIGEENIRPSLTGIDLNEKAMNFSFNLDVRGKRGDDALVEVMNFMDDAVMLGYPELRIVHGKGDGILRQLIRNHLRASYKQVATLSDEHADRGGAGVTIVKMKG